MRRLGTDDAGQADVAGRIARFSGQLQPERLGLLRPRRIEPAQIFDQTRSAFAVGSPFFFVACFTHRQGSVFYAAHVGAVLYNSFEIHLSILLLLAIILGRHAGSLGPLIGALFLVLVPELLRESSEQFLPFPIEETDQGDYILTAQAE